jgi:hypothetical protein
LLAWLFFHVLVDTMRMEIIFLAWQVIVIMISASEVQRFCQLAS